MLKLTPRPKTMSAGQRISRKYRRAHVRRLQRREFARLRRVIPSVAHEDEVSKISIVQEATKYIQHLHSAVSHKLKEFGFNVPSTDHHSLLKALQLVLPAGLPVHPNLQTLHNSSMVNHQDLSGAQRENPGSLHPLQYIHPHMETRSSHYRHAQKSLRQWRV